MKFNIIYTPGTVMPLVPLLHSLLRYCDAHFRLVDNGCLPPESRILKSVVEGHERLELWKVPSENCWPHGQVLDSLLELETSEHFCFLDSDIVASGPFLDQLVGDDAGFSATFSGAPIWLPPRHEVYPASFRSLTGEYIRHEDGDCLGCTYIAIYRTSELREIMLRFGLGFSECRWSDLSPDTRLALAQRNRKAELYDTGKAINALLQGPSRYVDGKNVHHLGGMSFGHQSHQDGGLVRFIRRLVPFPAMAIIDRIRGNSYKHLGSWRESNAIYERRVLFRDPVRSYFHGLLSALHIGNNSKPELPVTRSNAVNERLLETTLALEQAFHEYVNARDNKPC